MSTKSGQAHSDVAFDGISLLRVPFRRQLSGAGRCGLTHTNRSLENSARFKGFARSLLSGCWLTLANDVRLARRRDILGTIHEPGRSTTRSSRAHYQYVIFRNTPNVGRPALNVNLFVQLPASSYSYRTIVSPVSDCASISLP
jgi:hypothetical protein